jgi:membrane peptidoglycan carboxypeptidase
MSRYAVVVHRLTRGVGDTIFYAADGRPWFRLDEQRHDVPLSAISPTCSVRSWRWRTSASSSTQVSIRSASVGAVVRDVRHGGAVEGGSTLTQQLARTLFLSNVKTPGRKAKEAAIAL